MLAADVVKKLFGIHLAALRKEQRMSQEALANESGISRAYMGDVERGNRNISIVNLIRVAHALKIPRGRLLDFPVSPDVLDELKPKPKRKIS